MPGVVLTHIEIDEKGVAWIVGANTKVIEIVLDKRAYGWSPEEIHRQHPHLSLAQVYSALAYYHENKEKVDRQIEHERREAEALLAEAADPVLRAKLLKTKNSQ